MSHILSNVELRILVFLAEGLQSKEIANALDRKKPTVEGYIRVLYLKLDAKSRAQLVAQAFRIGVLREADFSSLTDDGSGSVLSAKSA